MMPADRLNSRNSSRKLRVQFVSTHHKPDRTGNAPCVACCARGLAARGFDISGLQAGVPHYLGWQVFPQGCWNSLEADAGLTVERVRADIPGSPSFLTRLVNELAHGVQFTPSRAVGAQQQVLGTGTATRQTSRALTEPTPRSPHRSLGVVVFDSTEVTLGVGSIPSGQWS